jgi:hypothetical protein
MDSNKLEYGSTAKEFPTNSRLGYYKYAANGMDVFLFPSNAYLGCSGGECVRRRVSFFCVDIEPLILPPHEHAPKKVRDYGKAYMESFEKHLLPKLPPKFCLNHRYRDEVVEKAPFEEWPCTYKAPYTVPNYFYVRISTPSNAPTSRAEQDTINKAVSEAHEAAMKEIGDISAQLPLKGSSSPGGKKER